MGTSLTPDFEKKGAMRFLRYDNRFRKYHGIMVYGIKQSKLGFFG